MLCQCTLAGYSEMQLIILKWNRKMQQRIAQACLSQHPSSHAYIYTDLWVCYKIVQSLYRESIRASIKRFKWEKKWVKAQHPWCASFVLLTWNGWTEIRVLGIVILFVNKFLRNRKGYGGFQNSYLCFLLDSHSCLHVMTACQIFCFESLVTL